MWKIKKLKFSYSTGQKSPNILEESDSTAKITPSHLFWNPFNSTGSSVTLYGHLNWVNISYTGQSQLEIIIDRLKKVTGCIRWSYVVDLHCRGILYIYFLILSGHMIFLFLIPYLYMWHAHDQTWDHADDHAGDQTCDQACDASCVVLEFHSLTSLLFSLYFFQACHSYLSGPFFCSTILISLITTTTWTFVSRLLKVCP